MNSDGAGPSSIKYGVSNIKGRKSPLALFIFWYANMRTRLTDLAERVATSERGSTALEIGKEDKA